MAPIANLTRITVVGTFVDLDGDPITGRVVFAPSFDVLCDPDENVIVDNIPLAVELDEEGSFSIVLPVADDPDVTPQGWTYRVSEPTGRAYDITLTSDVPGGVLDLVDAVPSGLPNPGVAILARRLRDSQDYAEPDGAPQDGHVMTWSTALSKYRPSAPVVYTAENARDDVGAALRVTGAATLNVDDAANTITLGVATGSTSGTVAAGNDARITGAASKAENLGDLLDASVARTNLGLGNAATRGVGTTSSDVAAGNDSRIVGAAQKASNLADLTDAAAARSNLGLANSATLAVGTSSGTVAAGDDSRIVGAAQKSANLGDLTDASAARTALGLANSATRAVGTASNTVAAGDDSRITGSAQKSSNLSDLASISTARTNLGLGDAAVKNTGTSSGTLAAGDDSRITGAAQKSANLSDLTSKPAARVNLGVYAWDAPDRHDLLEWNYPLEMMNGSTGTSATLGTIYGCRVDAQQDQPIDTVVIMVGTAATGLTNAIAVVVDQSGTEVQRTGNVSSTVNGATGPVELPLAAAFTPTPGTKYSVLLLFVGGTAPQLMRSNATSATQLNTGMVSTSPRRYYTAGTSQTAITTPITLSGTTGTGAQSFWVGLK